MEDFFDLDFSTPTEIINDKVEERDLYSKLLADGFNFTTEANKSGAAYIMKDGKFLFLEDNKKFFMPNKITHGSLDFYLLTKGYIKETFATRILCQTDNAIRINDGSNFSYEVLIGLPQNILTKEQEVSLINWLYYLMTNNKYKVSVGNELVSEAFQVYNLREVFPEEIITKIKSYYFNGKLREAKDIKGDR